MNIDLAINKDLTVTDNKETESTKKKANLRDIRDAIFSSERTQFKRTIVKIFGVEIELRQLSVSEYLKMQLMSVKVSEDAANNNNVEDRMLIIIETLLLTAYVPNTNEKVFTEADRNTLAALPTSNEWIDMMLLILSNGLVVGKEDIKKK